MADEILAIDRARHARLSRQRLSEGRMSASARGKNAGRLSAQRLTDFSPGKVAFAPNDGKSLLVVNQTGRIDLFDISNPGRPAKTTEITADANDAAFSPDGARIVSGGKDG